MKRIAARQAAAAAELSGADAPCSEAVPSAGAAHEPADDLPAGGEPAAAGQATQQHCEALLQSQGSSLPPREAEPLLAAGSGAASEPAAPAAAEVPTSAAAQSSGSEAQPCGSKAGTQAAVPSSLQQSAGSSGQAGVMSADTSGAAASAAAEAQASAREPIKPTQGQEQESMEALLRGAAESAEADTLDDAAPQVTDEPTAVKKAPVEALLSGQGSSSTSDEAEGLPASAGDAVSVPAEEQPSAERLSDQVAAGRQLGAASMPPSQGSRPISDEAEGLPASAGDAGSVPAEEDIQAAALPSSAGASWRSAASGQRVTPGHLGSADEVITHCISQ